MYKIKLSPYAKIFYTEWLLDPYGSRYNLSIDQILHGSLDVDRLRDALKRYVSESVLLNSHVQDIDGEPYFVKNDSINKLEYLDNPVNPSELSTYVSHSFDLHNEPLYRFKPESFLNNLSKYDKDTIMLIDHEFKGSKLNGFDVAKQLHEQGFTRLYLFSGRDFEKDMIPDYLSVILKTDIDALSKLAE